LQNLAFSGAYIRASLSPEMLGKLLPEVPIDASGPESYIALMRVVHSDSYPAMQKIKQQLESIKLANYPGENVELCCDDIISLSDQLDAAGAFVPDLLCTIVQTFEGTTDHRLMTWAMNRYELVAKRVKYLHSMQMGVDERDPQGYVNICHDVTAQWRSQTDSNRWTVSGGKGADKNAEPNLPAGYLAGCLPTGVTNGLSSAQVQAFTAAVLKQVGFANRGTMFMCIRLILRLQSAFDPAPQICVLALNTTIALLEAVTPPWQIGERAHPRVIQLSWTLHHTPRDAKTLKLETGIHASQRPSLRLIKRVDPNKPFPPIDFATNDFLIVCKSCLQRVWKNLMSVLSMLPATS
jgi:hypothetical protein